MLISKKIFIYAIVAAAVIAGGVYFVLNRSTTLKSTSSLSSEKIAVGEPCDARKLKSYNGGGNIQDTKGLQCYMYDDPSGQERKGVWIYPNQISRPIFLAQTLVDGISFKELTQNWKMYDDQMSFAYPKEWKVANEKSLPRLLIESNQTIVYEAQSSGMGEAPLQLAVINYYPHSKFETMPDYQSLKEFPDDQIVPDASDDTLVYVKNFELNGSQALLVERMENYDLGKSPIGVTVYVIKGDSYYAISYTKYMEPSIDFPVELIISSMRFK